MTSRPAPLEMPTREATSSDDDFDLDVSLVEVFDPAHLVSMTDDNCGSTCQKSTCISAI